MNDLCTEIAAPKPSALPIREEDFCRWVGQAEPSDRLEYYRGYVAVDRAKGGSDLGDRKRRELAAIADRALALAQEGRLLVVQKRHGPGDYSYYAIKTGNRGPCEKNRPHDRYIGSKRPTQPEPMGAAHQST